MSTSIPLKRKYRVGKVYEQHQSPGSNNKTARKDRVRQRANPPTKWDRKESA